MELTLLQIIFFGIVVALANILGGLALFPVRIHKHSHNSLRYILALGAGFMLAVTFIEIIPKTIEIWQRQIDPEVFGEYLYLPMLLLLGGYLLTQFFEHAIAPHFHLGAEIDSKQLIPTKSAYSAVGGLLIHAFFDGVSISAAAQVDTRTGILMFIAIFLHKFPEGFTIGSMILAAGKERKQVLIATSLVGLTTLFGVLIFYAIGTALDSSIGYALPIAAGVTLYVAASDLIPEINHHGAKNPLVSLAVFAGVAMFFGLHSLLHLF